VLTYVVVDPCDPAFQKPTKPVGPAYDEPQKGFVKTARGWRRVVPSPVPVRIIQWREIQKLMEQHFIVIACGGGGIPVIKNGTHFQGVEAVIDKDLASARLAEQIGADILLIATDEERVALDYGSPGQRFLDELSLSEARRHLAEGQFPEGSMGPKVRAVLQFLEGGGSRAIITSIERISDSIEGRAGTHFHVD
jgi:carbamate kinase